MGCYALLFALILYYITQSLLTKWPNSIKYFDSLLNGVLYLTLTAAVLVPSIMRGFHLKRYLYNQTYHVFEILSEDSEICLFLLLAYILLTVIKNKIIRRVLAIVPVMLYIYFASDVITLYTLNSRLLISDVLKYAFGMETHVINIGRNFISTGEGIILIAASLFFVTQYFSAEYRRNRSSKYLIILLTSMLAFALRFPILNIH